MSQGTSIDDWELYYKNRIVAHISIQLAINKEVKDFKLYSDIDRFGSFGDIVFKVEYESTEVEIYFILVKYNLNKTISSIPYIFENENATFNLYECQESFDRICNNADLEIFKDVKNQNFKFILFSNIQCINDGRKTKYFQLAAANDSSVMKDINTNQSPPYKIVMNQLSQNSKISRDFLAKCWIYLDQKHAIEIEGVVLNDLERNIYADKLKTLLNYFENWKTQQYNKKISKTLVINLILKNCLQYDTGKPLLKTEIENPDLIVKILNDFCFFSFINKTNLENIRYSIFKYIQLYLKVDKLDTNIEINFVKRETCKKSIKYEDLHYLLWQANKLPMLLASTQDNIKCIEFICEKFETYIKTKSFIVMYEQNLPTINTKQKLNRIITNLNEIVESFRERIPKSLQTVIDDENFVNTIKKPEDLLEFLKDIIKIDSFIYHPRQKLGEGSDGTLVFRGQFQERVVAVKRLLSKNLKLAEREKDTLIKIDSHPNVVRYHFIKTHGEHIYIGLELCKGNLKEYIKGQKTFGNIKPLEILEQITRGLRHLHANDIVHRDLKPQNILLLKLNGSEKVTVKISDFGLSKEVNRETNSFSNASGIMGTHGWIAPEILLGNKGTTIVVDIFSVGCLFYYVFSKGSNPPTAGDVIEKKYSFSNLKGKKWEQLIQIPLLAVLLSYKPEDRPKCETILSHPIFWNNDKILEFFKDVNNYLNESKSNLLESHGKHIFNNNWMDILDEEIKEDLKIKRGKQKPYSCESVSDLLRAIRNLKEHCKEKSEKIKGILKEFADYWLEKFPSLLVYVWIIMQKVSDKTVSKYYDDYKYSLDLLKDVENNFAEE